MKLFGLEFTVGRAKQAVMNAVDSSRGWFSLIKEPWGGAWQSHVTPNSTKEVLAFSAVFSCVTIIAGDMAKLGVKLMRQGKAGIFEQIIQGDPILALLKRPNRYQTWYKFIEQWIVCKLLYGNTYILKDRTNGKITALYILDSQKVKVLVAEDGGVYYQLSQDYLTGIGELLTLPASEIIHDMMVSLWHPLVGVSPIYACAMSATMGNKIQANSTLFFDNMSRPSGQLTAPGSINDETAERLKKDFQDRFSGGNIGRLLIAGDGLKYEPMSIPAEDAQLIDQLKWTVEDVARCFHVPMYKLGGTLPAGLKVEDMNRTYYNDCLQTLIESAEALLNQGLELADDKFIEFDLENLMRMDPLAQVQMLVESVKGSLRTPNEGRIKLNLKPLPGGDTVYMQQQNYSIAALDKRDTGDDPFRNNTAPPALPAPTPDPDALDEAKELLEYIEKELVWTMPA